MSNDSESEQFREKFILIGAGKLGSVLSENLVESGYQALKIINRTKNKARLLAEKIGCNKWSERLDTDDHLDVSFILLAVSDDQIPIVLDQITPTDVPVFHCSGSTPIDVFPEGIPNCGVLYPLQTFTSERKLNLSNVPVLLEASNDSVMKILHSVADRISNKVYLMSSEQRMKAHVSAVFASNFSNYMLIQAMDYIKKNGLPHDILDELIRETFLKAIELKANNVQTGPAARNDRKILLLHEEILKNDPSLQKIYNFVSRIIIDKINESR